MSTNSFGRLRLVFATGAALIALGMASLSFAGVQNNGLFELGDSADPLTVGSGDIDASTTQQGVDWAEIFVFGTKGDPKTLTTNLFGGQAAAFILDDVSAGSRVDRTAFPSGGSDKNSDDIPSWTWTGGSVPAKDDITNSYSYAKKDSNGDLIIYVGVEREDPSGSSHIDVEFYQNAIGLNDLDPTTGKCAAAGGQCTFSGTNKDGDILINMDFSKGGGFGTLTVRERHEGSKNNYDDLDTLTTEGCNADGTVCAVNNGGDINSASWFHLDNHGNPITSIPPNGFTEFGINVTKLTGRTDLCFATFMVKTRSSQSFTAELKDFALTSFEQCVATVATQIHKGDPVGATHVATDIQGTPVPTGTVVHDKAFVTGVPGVATPKGKVEFSFFSDNKQCLCKDTACSNAAKVLSADLVEVTAPTATTAGVAAIETPTGYTMSGANPNVSFSARYIPASGSSYGGATLPAGKCEPLTVEKGKSSVKTDIQLGTGVSVLNTAINNGTTVHDLATVSGSIKDSSGKIIDPTCPKATDGTPTKCVTFTLYSTANCTGTPVSTETATLSGGTANDGEATATSGDQTPNTADGSFLSYTATYSGDDNYLGSTVSPCEPICAFPFLK